MSTCFNNTIKFNRSSDFAISVKRAFFAYRVRKNCIAYSPIGIIGVLGITARMHKGQSGGFFGFLFFLGILPYLLWMMHYWATGKIRVKNSLKQVEVAFEPDQIQIVAGDEVCKIAWTRIKNMQKANNLIILFWDGKMDLNHAFAIPNSSLTEDTKKIIEQNILNNGGKIFS
jgi:hypothetical protein